MLYFVFKLLSGFTCWWWFTVTEFLFHRVTPKLFLFCQTSFGFNKSNECYCEKCWSPHSDTTLRSFHCSADECKNISNMEINPSDTNKQQTVCWIQCQGWATGGPRATSGCWIIMSGLLTNITHWFYFNYYFYYSIAITFAFKKSPQSRSWNNIWNLQKCIKVSKWHWIGCDNVWYQMAPMQKLTFNGISRPLLLCEDKCANNCGPFHQLRCPSLLPVVLEVKVANRKLKCT